MAQLYTNAPLTFGEEGDPQDAQAMFHVWEGSAELGTARSRVPACSEAATTSSGLASGLIRYVFVGAPVNSILNSASPASKGADTMRVPAWPSAKPRLHSKCSEAVSMTERLRPWKFGLQRPFWRCVRGEADVLLMARRERARAVKENEGIVVIKRGVKKMMKKEDEEWVTVRKTLGEGKRRHCCY